MAIDGTIYLRYRLIENEDRLIVNISSSKYLRKIYSITTQTFSYINLISFPLSDPRREILISFGFQDEEKPSITDEQEGQGVNNTIVVRQQFLGITNGGNRY